MSKRFRGRSGADPADGILADRMSINLELPDGGRAYCAVAPNKHRKTILTPMRQDSERNFCEQTEVALYRHAPRNLFRLDSRHLR